MLEKQFDSAVLPPFSSNMKEEVQTKKHQPFDLLAAGGNLTGYGFNVGDIGLLLNPEISSEVISDTPIYPIPNTVSWLCGLINLRGNMIPVFNLHQALEVSNDSIDGRYLLILDKAEKAVAIALHENPEAISDLVLSNRSFELPALLSPHIQQVYEDNERVWIKFDKESFFDALGAEAVVINQ